MLSKFVEVHALRMMFDSVIRDRVIKALNSLGVTGYTWWQAHGEGMVSEPGWSDSKVVLNRICVEVWCKPSLAQKIVEYSQADQFKDVAMMVGIHPIWIHEDEAKNLVAS